ncbi:coiled-coil domain-containing protein 110-like [Drosophila serrata]|uniref:coiled-coil domain-containing protein 110-like n=1 Tax=Drosophila serrata TaxID=7274 RepID=UPI000A1CFA51|nr:coiled-coil domain-containing protein 110-like [Drosophila serrata]
MPRKSQKSQKNSVEIVSRSPSRSPAPALSQEKPPSVVDTRKIRAISEIKKPPVEASKMADSCDRLLARAAAVAKLPVTPSNKSEANQLEVGQTRRSRERGDAEANIPTAVPVVATKAQKRSGTPLSSTFFEAYNKKVKIMPPRFDNSQPKLPVVVAGSKQLEGKSLKKSDLKLSQGKENAKRNENTADVKGGTGHGQGTAPKPASSVADIELASCESMESSAKGMLTATGNDKYYLEQFHKFYEDYRACNRKIAQRLLKLEVSNTEKHYENMSLNSRLNIMIDKKKNLENKLDQQAKLNAEVHEKYLDALKARTTVEKNGKNQLQLANSLIDQQKEELDKKQSEIDTLRAELNNIQEANLGMTSVLNDIQVKLKHTEETVANLLNQNNKQAAELDEQKRKMQDTVAEREVLERRSAQLESELKEKAQEVNKLNQRQVDFEELQLQNDKITNQLECSRNEKAKSRAPSMGA